MSEKMMLRILATALISLLALTAAAQNMLVQADDFLSSMPPQLQQKQQQAIEAAIEGNFEMLNAVRNARNTAAPVPRGVTAHNISPKYRLYTPDNSDSTPLPVLIYLHGGGWCFGSINSCSKFCAEIALRAQIAVLAVEYPLAPEHQYPQPLDASVQAVEFVFQNAPKYSFDLNAVSLGGDSAGGNLALAAALRIAAAATDNNALDMPLKSLVLFYPVTKVWNDNSPSWNKYKLGYGLDGAIMETFNNAYIARNNPQSPYISPFCAEPQLLSALPPTLIINAERDILADQGADMYDKLTRCGVMAQRKVYQGAVHLFITVDGQPEAFDSAVNDAAAFIHSPQLNPIGTPLR